MPASFAVLLFWVFLLELVINTRNEKSKWVKEKGQLDVSNLKLEDLPLDALVGLCQEQMALYREQKLSDPASCFEIWRRALQQRDEAAWEAIHRLYINIVRGWIRKQTGQWPRLPFEEESLINGAFFRTFRSIPPENFERFPSLSKLLQYFKLCCISEVLDTLRHYNAVAPELPSLDRGRDGDEDGQDEISNLLSPDNVEEAASNQADRTRFWKVVERHLPKAADKAAIFARFVEGLPPREILHFYPQYFADIEAVNRCLKNGLWRLRQDPELKNWFKELQG